MDDVSKTGAFTLGRAAESVLFLLFAALGAVCLDTTTPDSIIFMVTEYLDSARYSQLVGLGLIVASLVHVISVVRRGSGEDSRVLPVTTLAGAALTAAYVLGFTYIGFYISSLGFLAICCLLVERPGCRSVGPAAAFALFTVAALFAVFHWFSIYLPPAWLV